MNKEAKKNKSNNLVEGDFERSDLEEASQDYLDLNNKGAVEEDEYIDPESRYYCPIFNSRIPFGEDFFSPYGIPTCLLALKDHIDVLPLEALYKILHVAKDELAEEHERRENVYIPRALADKRQVEEDLAALESEQKSIQQEIDVSLKLYEKTKYKEKRHE